MQSLPHPYRALVVGAHGALGAAFVQHLQKDAACERVVGAVRQPVGVNEIRLDFDDPSSIEQAGRELQGQGPFHLLIDATGVLTVDGQPPEKRLADLDPATMMRAFAINTVGPAMLLKHLVDLLPAHERCVVATLSARVGSIGDNRKGGWYSYRASKAALNMVWRTAAIEVARRRPQAVLLALHPGTVFSKLSAPFVPAGQERPGLMQPETAAAHLLAVMDTAQETGRFMAYDGQPIEW
jgi:NAD(P)-dependent dehydrogenase (short-subunit alcohol dehydrogenase family)